MYRQGPAKLTEDEKDQIAKLVHAHIDACVRSGPEQFRARLAEGFRSELLRRGHQAARYANALLDQIAARDEELLEMPEIRGHDRSTEAATDNPAADPRRDGVTGAASPRYRVGDRPSHGVKPSRSHRR